MSKFCVFDIEATGFDVETVDVHCVALKADSSPVEGYRPASIELAIERLNLLVQEGYILTGHNIVEYDVPILRRFGLKVPDTQLYDTLVVSRAAYPGSTLFGKDHGFFQKNPHLEGEYRRGAHSLKAWGLRLGCPKDEYTGGFDAFNEEMFAYCQQDVGTNATLLDLLTDRIPLEASLLETQVAAVCRRMRLFGVAFDRRAAEDLAVRLIARRDEIAVTVKEVFKPWYVAEKHGKVENPKRPLVSKKYAPGEPGYKNVAPDCPFTKVKLVEFNPASTDHIADRLIKVYGWKPTQYTDGGKPQVTAEVLKDLKYPEAALLAEYQEIKKILGYVSEGNNSWLKLEKNGRVHGKVMPTGTVSGRASHNNPNTGNVPTRSELGKECRALFVAPSKKVIVGADASGLQLRIMAHYLAKWDDGVFARQCETGDIHETMRQATGLFTRSRQKTWTYAKLFGGGPTRLGRTVIDDWRDAFEQGLTPEPVPKQSKATALGKQTLANLGNAFPAFPKLDKALQAAAENGYLTTLDGRSLPISSAHIAIAMLLQGGEACIMKKAMVVAAPQLYELGAEFVLWVHDEFQVECDPEDADTVGAILVTAMRQAGEAFGLRVKIDGEYKVGKTWAETH